MTDDLSPQPNSTPTPETRPETRKPPTALQCFNGALIALLLAWGAYSLTQKIGTNFAAHPFQSPNYVAVNISVAVRTLVVGLCALATAVFAVAALGLSALGVQTLVKKLSGNPSAS